MEKKKIIEEAYLALKNAGYNVFIPNKKIPYYTDGVPCGVPSYVSDDSEGIFIPEELIHNNPFVIITAKGSSMIGAGINSGDELKLLLTTDIYDGDVVVVIVNGEATVKTFINDDRGNVWLLPQNEEYTPICLTEDDDVRILGKVVAVNKPVVRTSYADCSKMLKKAIRDQKLTEPLTVSRIKKAIVKILPKIEIGRHWYSVFRVLVDRKYYDEGTDVSTFVSDLNDWFPGNDWNLNPDDIRRMAVLSFRKQVTFWDENDAPVSGKRYKTYLGIANSFNKEL